MRTLKSLSIGQLAATICALFCAWTIYTPIPFTALKIATLLCLFVTAFIVAFSFQHGKWALLLVVVPMIAIALWPLRAPDKAQLRAQYVHSLRNYRGTRYVWGGENARGIDCSGLMRRGFEDALIAQGWRDKNPALWREAALIWWRDCSAREMKDGYSGRIIQLFPAKSLNKLNDAHLQSGDLAVTASGVHVLAFVGEKTWIQADPNLVNGGNKVIETTAPTKNGWFGQKVVICRWKLLDES